ncbi:MAG: glucodextranase DOMON-like domain-containing protein, partial [Desulfurococcaceae archaeon]
QNVEGWIFAVAVASFDGFGPMRVRQVVPGDPQEWLLGGGDPRAILAGVQPLVVDFLAPTAEEQYTLLSLYDPDTGRLAITAGMSNFGFMGPLILKVTVEVPVEVTITRVVTETLIETEVLTETVTVTVPEYTTAAVVGVVAIVIIAVLAYMLFKKK